MIAVYRAGRAQHQQRLRAMPKGEQEGLQALAGDCWPS